MDFVADNPNAAQKEEVTNKKDDQEGFGERELFFEGVDNAGQHQSKREIANDGNSGIVQVIATDQEKIVKFVIGARIKNVKPKAFQQGQALQVGKLEVSIKSFGRGEQVGVGEADFLGVGRDKKDLGKQPVALGS